jgi:hypothetical protein
VLCCAVPRRVDFGGVRVLDTAYGPRAKFGDLRYGGGFCVHVCLIDEEIWWREKELGIIEARVLSISKYSINLSSAYAKQKRPCNVKRVSCSERA